jgi:hypothetical protein
MIEFVSAAIVLVGAALPGGAQTPVASPLPIDAQALYVRALRTMRALPQPHFITFDSNFVGVGTGVQISRLANGSAQFAISTAGV